jgi:hypothetical protein
MSALRGSTALGHQVRKASSARSCYSPWHDRPESHIFQAVEVKWAEHRARRQRPPVEPLIERFEHGIDHVAQAIRARLLASRVCAAPRRRA